MSSLQISLAMAGGLILAAVVAYNAWQTHRNRLREAQPPAPEDTSPEQREPSLGDSTPSGFERPPAPRMHPGKSLGLDGLIDVMVPVVLDSIVSGDAILAAMPVSRHAGRKPWALEGLNHATEIWEVPQPGQRYRSLQLGLQLANRTGPINEIEYSEFVAQVQTLAEQIGGTPEVPEMIEQVQRGRELDQFASAHDVQLSFTLRSDGAPWSPGFVQQHAERLGFKSGGRAGRLVLPSTRPDAPPLLGLSYNAQAALAEDLAQSALYDVMLSLDVPQVDRAEQPFECMRAVAVQLAQNMGGVLTDDRGQIIPPHALDNIGAELQALYDILEQRDLAAGSPQARRLFS